jgi:hypothetical protein
MIFIVKFKRNGEVIEEVEMISSSLSFLKKKLVYILRTDDYDSALVYFDGKRVLTVKP